MHYIYQITARLIDIYKEVFYGKELILADRDMVETESDEILRDAGKEDVALLVVGDPFGYVTMYSWIPLLLILILMIASATTHTDIILRARSLKIPVRVVHNASIMNAVGACGLQLYNFGQTVSLVFFTETWKPDSFYDRIKENVGLGMHTLVLLDIKVKEQSEENLARYVHRGYSSFPTYLDILFITEAARSTNLHATCRLPKQFLNSLRSKSYEGQVPLLQIRHLRLPCPVWEVVMKKNG